MQVSLTPEFLGNLLDTSPEAAKNNVFRALQATGLVDETGKPTERAGRWRDDEQYAAVCEEIRQEIYPPELLHVFSGPDDLDRARVARLFQQTAGVGRDSARKMGILFRLLMEADVTKEDSGSTRTGGSSPKRARKKIQTPNGSAPPTQDTSEVPTAVPDATSTVTKRRPSLHIDIQIHISPESDADQIDQIFKSMAKHLNLREAADGD